MSVDKYKDLFERAQRGEPIDLLEIEQEVGPELVLPNRRKFRVRLFDGPHYQMYERVQREPNDADADALLRYAIPKVTKHELATLSPIMANFICQAAARQAEGVLFLLRKNAERPARQQPAPAEVSEPPRSTPATKSSTSSRASRGRSPKQAGSGP